MLGALIIQSFIRELWERLICFAGGWCFSCFSCFNV